MTVDHTHNPSAASWVPGADEHAHFPVQNLPFGVFSQDSGGRRIGCAIGDRILDLTSEAVRKLLPVEAVASLNADRLNGLFSLESSVRRKLRHALFAMLTSDFHRAKLSSSLVQAHECEMHLPFRIGDYTDFYVGIHHASNIGKQFRPDNPLLPNYKYVPIGYHGRASSVRISGQEVVRPKGQIKLPDAPEPSYAASQRLDYELELGVWISGENALGCAVTIAEAPDRIAGLCLLNDWSSRDIQGWEYQPLGPFLSKNFHTTISPWVVTTEALAPFMIAQPSRPDGDPQPLPYLWSAKDQAHGALSVTLEVYIRSAQMRSEGVPAMRLSSGPASNMYWTIAQMVTHHASGGCNLMPGDLLGTGTISGSTRESFGSMMEISSGGTVPIELPNGELRTFLQDGDEITISASAAQAGFRSIGFGTCTGTIAAARE